MQSNTIRAKLLSELSNLVPSLLCEGDAEDKLTMIQEIANVVNLLDRLDVGAYSLDEPLQITPPDPALLAPVAYAGYAESTGGKTFDGRDMPKWEDLPARTVKAWESAIRAAQQWSNQHAG